MSLESEGPPNLAIETRETPNHHSITDRRITGAVIHYTAGSFAGSLDWLTRPGSKVSAHYLIGREGRIVQMCPLALVAWHAGCRWGRYNPNAWSVGYELEATAADGYTFTDRQYDVLSRHLAWLALHTGLKLAYPDGDPASYRPQEYWRHYFADKPGWVIGHSAVNPGKPDPGEHFDWSRLLDRDKFNLAEQKK